MSDKVAEYRRFAQEARRNAAREINERARESFLHLAASWDLLADEREGRIGRDLIRKPEK